MIQLCIALLLCIASAELDFPYHQDIGHISTFKSSEAVAAWEVLPFEALSGGNAVAHLQGRDCFISISDGVLFSSSRNMKHNKLSLGNPYSAWSQLSTVGVDAAMIISSTVSGYDFFVISSTNVMGFVLSDVTSEDMCGTVTASKELLESPANWANLVSITSSSSSVFISHSAGLTQVVVEDGAATDIDATTDISVVYWVEEWQQLFVGSSVKLTTYTFDGVKIVNTLNEWITGNIDSIPLDMSYDVVNDALWLAEKNSVHKLKTDGSWWRYGLLQGSPNGNITSVSAVNGYVWVGSAFGVARVLGNADPITHYHYKLGGRVEHHQSSRSRDPWTWFYYGGNRFLPDGAVSSMVGGGISGLNDGEAGSYVLAITSTGMSLIESTLWTLKDKAIPYQSYLNPRHNRHYLTTSVSLNAYGDVSQYENVCSDNDGLWTSMSAMAEVYRFLSTKSEDARTEAWHMFEALEFLSIVPGNYPYFPARSFATLEESASLNGCDGDPWMNSTEYPGYKWKSTTSSDELDGHLAIYPLIYDHIATTDVEKKRVYDLIEGITGGILANDYYLIDPATGEPTIWGFWNPAAVNDNPEHYSERGTNSLGILAYVASAYSITRDVKYKDSFWDLGNNHNYFLNSLNVKIDNPDDNNHSDNELIFQTYHILFYAYDRLDEDDALKAELKSMVDMLVPSLRRTWTIIGGEFSPLWLGMYAGTCNQEVVPEMVSAATWTLRHWGMDMIDWPIDNNNRWDVTTLPYIARDGHSTLMKELRPPQERQASKWNSDPFVLSGGGGRSEEMPSTFTLPYYLMLYHGFITEE